MKDFFQNKRRELSLLALTTIAAVLTWVLTSTGNSNCEIQLYDTDKWEIVASDIDAKIAWAKKRGTDETIIANRSLVDLSASGGVLAFLDVGGQSTTCRRSPVIALDVQTGKFKWDFDLYSGYADIIATNHGFLISSRYGLWLIKTDGSIQWERVNVLRGTTIVYQVNDRIYLLSYASTPVVISETTGIVLEDLNIPDVMTFYNDRPVYVEDRKLLIQGLDDFQIPLERKYHQPRPINPSWPEVKIKNDLVILIYENTVAFVYDLKGNKIWEKAVFYGSPVFYKDNLVFYTQSGLEFWSIETGEQTGYIKLKRNPDFTLTPPNPLRTALVEMIASGDKIIISIRDANEIIALQINQ